jgi:hypothetical protein
MDERDAAFYEDVGTSIDAWTEVAVDGLSGRTTVDPQVKAAFAT